MTDNTDEIATEQAYLTTLYEHLDQLRRYTQSRLSTVLLESGGTPQARSERESFSAMYTEDLAKFDAAENGLCFGRLDLVDDETRYIGRLGLLDEDNDFEPLLLDWRAPLARPFYLATPASPDGVILRRHIRSRSRKVTSVGDEYLDLRGGRHATEVGGVAGESALLDALDAARTGHMNDIVETIQGEQDRIIRSEHKSVMVVQGGPGTGKTAVALHRAAYLLYTYRNQLARSGVLIIGPNETFLDYIGQVLPSLGETGVLLSTIGNLYPGVKASVEDSVEASTLKGSTDMIDVLRNAVRDRQQIPSRPVEIRFDGYTIALDRKMCTRARGRARSSRRPHNLARPLFASAIVEALAEKFAGVVGQNLVDGSNLLSRSDIADIRDDMRRDPEVQAAIERLWPELTPQQVLTGLLGSADRLATAAPNLTNEQRAALVRTTPGRFGPADAPLLDELAELLGIDESAEQEKRARQWRKQIADAQGALDILTGSAPQDLEDELDPEILMAYDLIDAGQLAERQRSTSHLTTAERAAGDRTWTYGHVIVDEAQELSEMAWRMLMRRCPNRWMTVVGDTAQTGDPAGSSSWGAVLEPYVANRWKLHELTVNYRTPSEIMDVATAVLDEIAPDQTPPRSIRSSGHVPWVRKVRSDEHLSALRAALAEVPADRLSAVLVPAGSVDDYRELAGDTVSVLTVGQAKGLEFDAVFLVEPQLIVDESPRGMNDLYVALTRATQWLGVVHSLDLPPVLDGLAEAST